MDKAKLINQNVKMIRSLRSNARRMECSPKKAMLRMAVTNRKVAANLMVLTRQLAAH